MRAASRRHEILRWMSPTALNRLVPRFHPRWQRTTLLHLAAAHGMEDVALRLLQRGAAVEARDSCGATPLDEARAHNRPQVLALLLAWRERRDGTAAQAAPGRAGGQSRWGVGQAQGRQS
mmetsp:Transcript_10955/g.34782  ORF Transcript_10955/g.34782 Transcript_10955/m.34782 type:complete len:120 (+) Transcript_10955:3-362(+)